MILLYPLRAARWCGGLAAALTAVSALAALYLPDLLVDPPSDPWTLWALCLGWALLLALAAAVFCTFLDCVFRSAVAGDDCLCWSGSAVQTVAIASVRWSSCFLAGPAVFVGMSIVYWLTCGDPSLFDWAILAELAVAAIAYQHLTLLAYADRGRLRDLNPVAIADLAYRLGWRMVTLLAAAALLLVHALVVLAGMAAIHAEMVSGWAILAAGWASTMYWCALFCRYFGVWCHHDRQQIMPGLW